MEKIRSIQEAKAKAQRSVDYYNARVEAWERVKRLYTKGGQPFKVLSKNFENLTFREEYGSKKATVFFYTKTSGYEHDDIYLTDIEELTPDAVSERIAKVIDNYKEWREKDEKGLAEIESQLAAIEKPLEALKAAITAGKETNTNYIIQSYIKNYLGILND